VRRAAGVALGGLLLTLVAFTFDATPLFVVGVGFAAIGLGAPIWVWLTARSTTLARELHHDRVVEGEQFETTIEVKRGPLGLPGAELHDPLSAAPVRLSSPLSLLSGGRAARVRVLTRFTRRGLRKLDPPTLVVRDPLDLASVRCKGAGAGQELLVLPFTEPVRWRVRDRALRSERASGPTPGDPLAAVDIDGLRPYQPGTPASRIHWPALARGAGLLERRLRADGDTRPLVVLDARCGSSSEPLDAAVRAAASLTLELAKAGGCRLLLPGDRRAIAVEPDLIAWPAAHARLALIEGGSRERAPMLDPGSRLGSVFYVSAHPIDRLPGVLTVGGPGAAVLVLPDGVGGTIPGPARFEVTGCRGYVVRARAFARVERVA
jgi:uncharacterized protein (DUF58 family)